MLLVLAVATVFAESALVPLKAIVSPTGLIQLPHTKKRSHCSSTFIQNMIWIGNSGKFVTVKVFALKKTNFPVICFWFPPMPTYTQSYWNVFHNFLLDFRCFFLFCSHNWQHIVQCGLLEGKENKHISKKRRRIDIFIVKMWIKTRAVQRNTFKKLDGRF